MLTGREKLEMEFEIDISKPVQEKPQNLKYTFQRLESLLNLYFMLEVMKKS